MSAHKTSSDRYRIREALGGDLERVRALLSASDLPLDGLDDHFGPSYAVAEHDGAIIGVEGIEVYEDDGLLRSAAVDPAWRGRGVGDALTRNRIDWARDNGLRSLYLLTTTAGTWFPRFGFVAESRDAAPGGIRASREFAEACPSTALFMKLPLSETL